MIIHDAHTGTPGVRSRHIIGEKPLERLMTSLIAQTESILNFVENDQAYFDELTGQLDERFQKRLGLFRNCAD